MSKKTRILALVLTVVMLVGAMPLTLFAQEETTPATEAEESVSVLDALAAEATGSLYGGITVPEGATKIMDEPCALGIGSGSERDNGIYVDSGWGDGSKSLVDTVDNLTGGTTDDSNTNITFQIIPTTGAGTLKGQRYFVASFNIKAGEAYDYDMIYRIRIRAAYPVTTTYDKDGNKVGDPVTSTTKYEPSYYPISYSASTKQLSIAAKSNDSGEDIALGSWSTETYTNFGLIIDFEANTAYYYMNGKLVATDSTFLNVQTSKPDADGNYTVTTYDLSKATFGLNPMFGTNNPYGGEYAQYGKTTAYVTNNTAHVFDNEGNFLQENKDPANGVFKFRGNYYLYKNGMLVTEPTDTVGDYTLEIDEISGMILNYYKNTRSDYTQLTKEELIAKGAEGFGTTYIKKLSSAAVASMNGTGKITAYRYQTDDSGDFVLDADGNKIVETYEIDALRSVDYVQNNRFGILALRSPGDGVSYYASEADLLAGKLTTQTKALDMQYTYEFIGGSKTIKTVDGKSTSVRDFDKDFIFSFDAIAGDGLTEVYSKGIPSSTISFIRARTYYQIDLAEHDESATEPNYSYVRADETFITVKIIDGVPYIWFNDTNCGEFSTTVKTNFTILYKMDETRGPLISLFVNGELKSEGYQLMSSVGKNTTYNNKKYEITDHCIQNIGNYFGTNTTFDGHLFTYYAAKYYTASENYESITDSYTGFIENGDSSVCYENGKIAALGSIADVEAKSGKKFAQLEGYNVALADTIHLNFYARLGSVVSEAGAYALLTVDGEEQKIALNSLVTEYGLYKLTAKLSSIQMAKRVSLRFFDGNGNQLSIQCGNTESYEYSCSVKQYAECILADASEYDTETVELVKAMLLYGAFAERHFAGKKDLNTARMLTNEERLAVQYGTIGLFYTNIKVSSNKAEIPYKFTYTENDHTEDVNLTATATDPSMLGQVYLVLDSAIKIRIELNVTEAPEAVSGCVLHTEEVDGTVKYFVDITGLTAKDLNTTQVITVNGNIISVSALAAAGAVVSAGNAVYGKTFTDLMKAMYLYYYYANAYVEAMA